MFRWHRQSDQCHVWVLSYKFLRHPPSDLKAQNQERLTAVVAELDRREEWVTGWSYRIQSSLSWPALHCRATSNWERTSWENLGQDSCREICRHISKPSLVDIKWRSKRSASKEWEKSKYLSWSRLTFLTGLPLVTTTPSEVMLHFSSCNRGSLLRHYSLNFIAEKSS